MSFLLLGIDSLIACIADRRADRGEGSRVRLAALFGLADGVGFLIGAGLGWAFLSGAVSEVIEMGALVVLGVYLLVVATATTQLSTRWYIWALPICPDGGQPHLRHRRRADGLARR